MKAFIRMCSIATLVIASPYLALLIHFAFEDPFRLNTYPPYIKGFHHINRGVATTNGYLKNTKIDALILGNSRSISLRCDDWAAYTFQNDVKNCFHFDASGDNLFGFQQKARLIKSENNPLEEVLIVLDDESIQNYPLGPHKFPFVRHPIYRELSLTEYYWVFVKQYLNLKYQFAHLSNNTSSGAFWVQDFSYHECKFNPKTGDYITAKEAWIKKDSVTYYMENLVFDGQPNDSFYEINNNQLQSLSTTVNLFESIGANCTILFQPRFTKNHPSISTLNKIALQLPTATIIDASHLNEIIDDPGYWYETSHFRPMAGKMIIKAIQSGELKPHALQQP